MYYNLEILACKDLSNIYSHPSKLCNVISSVVPMIDYNCSFTCNISMIEWNFRESIIIDYNRKNPQVKEFHFYFTPNANFCSILVIR